MNIYRNFVELIKIAKVIDVRVLFHVKLAI